MLPYVAFAYTIRYNKRKYETASRNCTETIRNLDLAELKERCGKADTKFDFEDFEITGRIGNYILIDSKRKKICIVNNRVQVKEYKKPEINEFSAIDCGIPRITQCGM